MLTMERVGSSRLRRMRSARSPRSQYSIDEYCVYDGYEQPPASKQKGKRHPAPLTKTHSLGIQPSLSPCSRSPTSPTYLSTSPTYLGDDLLLSPVGNLSPRSPTPSDSAIELGLSKAMRLRLLLKRKPLSLQRSESQKNRSLICLSETEEATFDASFDGSDNTSDADNMSDSPRERRRDRHHLCPDSGSNTNRYSVNDEQFDKMPSGGGFVRRAASFTYSPKGTLDKNNQRPAQLQEKEQTKKGFFGPISKTLSYLRNKMDTALSTSQLYPTKDEVRQWETSFEALLNNKQGCALFRQFLKKEFSDENVDFWCACEEFKNIKDPKKLKQKAHEIYKEFVAEQAPKEVNLDSDTRAATKAAIFEEVVKLDTFSLAQSRIEQLMAKDSYRRFLKDRIYLDMLEGFENGTNSNTGSTANLANGNNSPK